MKKPVQVPGEETPAKAGITELNNANDDPNKIGAERERALRRTAVLDAGADADLAPEPPLAKGAKIVTRKIGGKDVQVSIPPVARNADVKLYGKENGLPAGTPVNKDGTPCAGAEEPYGVIGSIKTDRGWLVGRVIPLQDEAA